MGTTFRARFSEPIASFLRVWSLAYDYALSRRYDWVIDHLNQIERVVNRLRELRPQRLALSIASLAELYEGVYSSRDRSKASKPSMPFSKT